MDRSWIAKTTYRAYFESIIVWFGADVDTVSICCASLTNFVLFLMQIAFVFSPTVIDVVGDGATLESDNH